MGTTLPSPATLAKFPRHIAVENSKSLSHLPKFPLFSRWDIKIWMRRRILAPPIFLSQKDIPFFLILFLSRKTFSEFLNFPVGLLVVAFVAQIQYSPSLPFSPPYGRSWVIFEFWIWWTKRNFKPFYHSIYNWRGKFPTLLWYIYTCTYFKFLGLCFSYILSSSSFYLINWIKIGLGSRRMKENYSFLSWFHTRLLSCLQENSNESTFCNLVLSFWQV